MKNIEIISTQEAELDVEKVCFSRKNIRIIKTNRPPPSGQIGLELRGGSIRNPGNFEPESQDF